MDCTDKPCNDDVLLRDISKKLNSSLEARMLVGHVTGLTDADLIGMDELPLSESQTAQLNDYIAQRLIGRPVSKIIGIKEFYGREFIVSDDVLDPRPDSETLIEAVLNKVDDTAKLRILDLGTGSGCLILTLLSELPNATGVAVDISDKALKIARQNAEKLGVCERVRFMQSNWFESIDGMFDIIISNPPYIESETIQGLAIDVKKYDPRLALDGGEDGLIPYKVILPQIRTYLNKGGIVALEYGAGQSPRIIGLLENEGLDDIETHKDLGGHDRVICAIHK